MKNEYDITVIGAGLSSLMFLSKTLKSKPNLSILVLEQKKTIDHTQSFCVWEGPGLNDIEKEYKLKSKYSWDKIFINDNVEKIKKNISPYRYVYHDGFETLKSLKKQIKSKVEILYDTKVKKIDEQGTNVKVTSSKGTFISNYLVDSRPKVSKDEIKSEYVHQAFLGTEIELASNNFDNSSATIMSFSKNKKETEFVYQLPFSKRRTLVETTLFSSNPDLKKLKSKHNKNLKKFGSYKILRSEKGIIPMALIKAKKNKRILRIGTGAGMVRASSGYSMRKIANWIKTFNGKKLGKSNLLTFEYSHNPTLDFFDKIFLRVIKNYPDKSNHLFLNLFKKSRHSSLIRFLSDKPSWLDILNIILSMPKILMLKGLFKKDE